MRHGRASPATSFHDPPTPIIMGHETVGEIYYLPDASRRTYALR